MRTKHSRLLYSFLAFLISAVLHASLWGFIVTYKTVKKTEPPKKIAMQMAMFKQIVVPTPVKPVVQAVEPEVKSIFIPPLESVVKKIVSNPKPIIKPKPKPKPIVKLQAKPKPKPKKSKPKKIKKKVKKELKKKKIVKKKKVVKKKMVKKKSKKVAVKVKPKPKRFVQKTPVPKVARRKVPRKTQQSVNNRVNREAQLRNQQRRAKQAQVQARRIAAARQRSRATPRPRVQPRKAPTSARVQRKPVAPVRTHNPQLERQYKRSVQQRIEQKKSYPRRAKRMRQMGVVKVSFSINKMGVVSGLRIVQSSKIKSLDQAAMQAVKKVGRFPVFPAGMNKQLIRYIIPIAYQLN